MSTPCRLFDGAIHPRERYGMRKAHGEQWAHRVAWVEANGPIPEGKMVLHSCDNRACVEVKHLRLGTHLENMADRRERNRTARGERHGASKLTDADVETIRRLLANQTATSIAKRFGVSKACISNIATGRTHGPPRESTTEEREKAKAGMRRSRARRREVSP